MKIRFDGKDYNLDVPAEAAAYTQAVADFQARHAKALDTEKARADAAEAKAKKAEADLADTKRFDAAVEARVSLYGAAAAMLGTSYVVNGKSDREIMLDVIRADDKDFDGKDRSDDYVRARFDLAVKSGVRHDSIQNAPRIVREVEQNRQVETRSDSDTNEPDPDKARAEMVKRNRSAWETPVASA